LFFRLSTQTEDFEALALMALLQDPNPEKQVSYV
jgi:hypothetical protein